MSKVKLSDIDNFCKRMRIDNHSKIDVALLVELLDVFGDEQITDSSKELMKAIEQNVNLLNEKVSEIVELKNTIDKFMVCRNWNEYEAIYNQQLKQPIK